MLTFLFWNVARRELGASVARLAKRHDADIVILVESQTPHAEMFDLLAEHAGDTFHLPYTLLDRIRIYTRFSAEFTVIQRESPRFAIHHVELPAADPFILAAAHMPDKSHTSEESAHSEFFFFSQDIRAVEEKQGHQRTIAVGDFNAGPFEQGVVSAAGLNAVPSRRIAARGSRTVQGRKHTFFYNPMWNLFGDHTPPPGTFYYDSSADVQYFWNMFDQVLVRPSLLDRFSTSELAILTSDGDRPLVTPAGLPDGAQASDHLPIVFRLNL